MALPSLSNAHAPDMRIAVLSTVQQRARYSGFMFLFLLTCRASEGIFENSNTCGVAVS